jgi:hypothetical protein
MAKKRVVITINENGAPQVDSEGFDFAGEVVILLQYVIQAINEKMKEELKSSIVLAQGVQSAPFIKRG